MTKWFIEGILRSVSTLNILGLFLHLQNELRKSISDKIKKERSAEYSGSEQCKTDASCLIVKFSKNVLLKM